MVTQIYKIWSEIWVDPSPEIWRPKTPNFSAILDNFAYFQNATRHQSEKNVANYGNSRTGKLNLVYFGPQTAKNVTGVLNYPTDGHASSCRRLPRDGAATKMYNE